MPRALRMPLAIALLGGLALTQEGCSLGPQALQRTHCRYNESVRRVYEEQFLLNLLHMRYNEVSSSLDVTAIATQYELSAQAEARPFFSTESTGNLFRSFSTVLPDASVSGVFNSRNFGTAANRPALIVTAVPEPTVAAMAAVAMLLASAWRRGQSAPR